jgi:hypothetical protein
MPGEPLFVMADRDGTIRTARCGGLARELFVEIACSIFRDAGVAARPRWPFHSRRHFPELFWAHACGRHRRDGECGRGPAARGALLRSEEASHSARWDAADWRGASRALLRGLVRAETVEDYIADYVAFCQRCRALRSRRSAAGSSPSPASPPSSSRFGRPRSSEAMDYF